MFDSDYHSPCNAGHIEPIRRQPCRVCERIGKMAICLATVALVASGMVASGYLGLGLSVYADGHVDAFLEVRAQGSPVLSDGIHGLGYCSEPEPDAHSDDMPQEIEVRF